MSLLQSRNERNPYNSLPLRGGRWRRRRRMRADREDIPRFKVLFALFAHRKEGFPSGEENCKQFVAQATDEGGSICTLHRNYLSTKTERHACRSLQYHVFGRCCLIRSALYRGNTPAPPKTTKNFPHVPATSNKRNKSSLCKWRGYGGSSGWVREAWRVGRAPFKGSPCASKVFLILFKPLQTYERQHPCSIPYRFRQESACR